MNVHGVKTPTPIFALSQSSSSHRAHNHHDFVARPCSLRISSLRASSSAFWVLPAASAAFFLLSSASLATSQTARQIVSIIFSLPSVKLQSSPKCENILCLSDLEYSFSIPTKSSNSCCRSSWFSRLRFRRSGLYRARSSSSVGVSHIVKAGPPIETSAPLQEAVFPYPAITLDHIFHLKPFAGGIVFISFRADRLLLSSRRVVRKSASDAGLRAGYATGFSMTSWTSRRS
ncbi:hypothetical protein LIA77_08628 [Sarocladium implicatum]|nr:hypothetical protein LIA77_08628 [Sarocladium implicatum]